MLEAYRRMQANGAIGPMMKVDAAGNVVVDPEGKMPGSLVPRPFVEYPKAVRRYKEDGTFDTLVAHSRSEELKIIAEVPSADEPRSPLEAERDDLARELSAQTKINGTLVERLEAMEKLVRSLAPQPATSPVPSVEAPKADEVPQAAKTVEVAVSDDVKKALGRGFAALTEAEVAATKGAQK